MKTTLSHRHHRRQGFSLPEVTLALGIAAFGITTLLSFLPQGINNIRKAGEVAASSRISQHILGSLDQAQLQTSAARQRYYFNAHAIPLDLAHADVGDIMYVAEVAQPEAVVSLPGAPRADDDFLRRVTVRLKQTQAADYDFEQAPAASYKLYSYVIARTGK